MYYFVIKKYILQKITWPLSNEHGPLNSEASY